MTEPLDLEPIKARLAAASEGPWLTPEQAAHGYAEPEPDGQTPVDHEGCRVWPWRHESDMDFAYAARVDVPALVAEVEHLRAVQEKIDEALWVFDGSTPPRPHVEALDFVAEVRYALGGHHVAYPENMGNPRYDRSAADGPWKREP